MGAINITPLKNDWERGENIYLALQICGESKLMTTRHLVRRDCVMEGTFSPYQENFRLTEESLKLNNNRYYLIIVLLYVTQKILLHKLDQSE